MAKFLNDSVLDSLLDKIATGTQIIVNTTQPANRVAALSDALATASLSSGDFSKSDRTGGGRTLTIAAKSAIPVTATGNAQHVSIINATELLAVTTATAQVLTDGNTVTIPSWTASVSDPS